MNIQHRAANDALGNTNHGALVKIYGFDVKPHHRHRARDHDHDGENDWGWR